MGHGQSRRLAADDGGPFALKLHSDTCEMRALLQAGDFMPFIDELKRRAQLIATDTGALDTPLVMTGSRKDSCILIYLRCECPGLYVGVDVNVTDIRGQTALHSAVRRRSIDAVEILLQQGCAAYCDRRNTCGMTPLHTACEVGSVRMVQLLLDAGADPDAAEEGRFSAEARTPLSIAASYGSSGCVAALTRAGAALDGRDGMGSTPLHRAALHGHACCLRVLLDAGASPDTCEGYGATPLQLTLARRRGHATPGGSIDAVRMLLDSGCDVRSGSVHLPPVMLLAAVAGEMDVLKACLLAGVSPDICDSRTGRSALHYVFSGDLGPLHKHYATGVTVPQPHLKQAHASPWSVGMLDVTLPPPRRRREVFACLVSHGADVQTVLAYAIAADGYKVRRYNADLLCAAIAGCGFSRLAVDDLRLFLSRLIGASGNRVVRALLAAVPALDDAIRQRLREATDWTGERDDATELASLEDAGVDRGTAVWMQNLVRRPRTLRDWSRLAVRRQLGDNVTSRVDRLPLPLPLRGYVAFQNELDS